jgi:hypothetical protein
MRTLEQCRRKAQECRVKASRARDPEAKAIYESMARQWDEMADQIETRRLKSLNVAYRAAVVAAGARGSLAMAGWH